MAELGERLAIELASRLRERSKLMRKANDVPHVFIGSTAEKIETARTIQAAFSYDGFVVRTIEYWGMEQAPEYAARKREKKNVYEKYEMNLVELGDQELKSLEDHLPRLLRKFGVEID